MEDQKPADENVAMSQKPSNVNVSLINGLYLGAVLIVYSLILYVAGFPRDNWLQYISYLFMVIGVVLAIKQWRDKYNNGFLTYGQAFSNGFLTILFAGILTSVYIFVFFQFIAPEEITKMAETTEERMYQKNPNMSEADIEMGMKYATMFMKPWLMSILGLFFNALAGLIISAIVSIFMKKENNQFD
jgi:hypothetical protein